MALTVSSGPAAKVSQGFRNHLRRPSGQYGPIAQHNTVITSASDNARPFRTEPCPRSGEGGCVAVAGSDKAARSTALALRQSSRPARSTSRPTTLPWSGR